MELLDDTKVPRAYNSAKLIFTLWLGTKCCRCTEFWPSVENVLNVPKMGVGIYWLIAAPPPAATDTDIPLLAIVPEAFVPAKAAVAATKFDPALEAIAVVSPLCEAVIVLPAKPNETPLELLNTTLLVVTVLTLSAIPTAAAPAAPPHPAPDAATDATTEPPELLNVTLLELAKLRVLNVDEPPDAEKAPPPPAAFALAVITDPFIPKLTPLLLLKVSAVRLLLVVPAETLMALISPAVDGTV